MTAEKTTAIEHIRDLVPDKRNARKHTARNVGMLVNSLHEVGAARSIVIDEDGVILAGNATVEAAGQAGIERVRVVEADGNEIIAVRRSGLSKKQKTRLALFDNRVAELADWDKDVLQGMVDEDESLVEGMWKESELVELLDEIAKPLLQVIPLMFLPDEVSEVEGALPELVAAYGDSDKYWLARLKEYDRVMNGMGEVINRKQLRYVHQAILYLIRFWKENYFDERVQDAATG